MNESEEKLNESLEDHLDNFMSIYNEYENAKWLLGTDNDILSRLEVLIQRFFAEHSAMKKLPISAQYDIRDMIKTIVEKVVAVDEKKLWEYFKEEENNG